MNTVVVYRAGNTVTTFRSERAFGVAAARVSLETFSHHPTETTSLDAQSRARAGGDMTEGLALEREGDALLTSGLWNRRRDLRAVRRHLGTEFGSDPADVEVRCARTDAVLATGYRRVLLGDHGPYLELDPEAVRWENLRRVHAGDARFYDEWRVAVGGGGGDDAVSTPENAPSRSARADEDTAKLYHQIKPVTGQRNPPRDTAWAVANNRPEAEGYAAYVPGRVYVGAFDARVRGRAMPTPRGAAAVGDDGAARAITRNAGRVAWWRPSEGRGGIVPEGVTGLRNAADGVWDPDKAREKGEIAVFREDLGFGAAALVPGEGVWFEESLDAVDRAASTTVDSTADTAHKSATPSDGPPSAPVALRRAVRVTGPGGEPPRRACPGYAEAEAAAAAAARLASRAAAAKKAGGTPAARAAERAAMVPWARRAEAERRATASAMRRVARILRDNCARIVAERGARTRRLSTNEAPINGRAPKASLPAWLAATGRGAVACPVLETCVGALNLAARAAGETVAGNGGRAEGGSAAGSASASAAELTEEGLRGLRRRAAGVAGLGVRGVRGVRGREDERRDGNEEDEEDEDETVSASLRAFDDVLPAAGVGDGPLVVVLPAANRRASTRDDSSKKNAGGGGGLGHRAALALRASPRCVGVVLVSEGPDAAVKDAVALAGACAFGTEPFVPTSARAAAPDQSTPAVTLTTLERVGFGAATAMASAAGRAYCWHCGDAEHIKGACPRRGEDGGTVDVSSATAAVAALKV